MLCLLAGLIDEILQLNHTHCALIVSSEKKKVKPVAEETTMSQGLHATDDSAGYDAACKRVLSEKAILARIMKACLEEYKDCGVNEIAERYIEGQPQVSAVPVLPDEEGSLISGMDTEDKSVHEGSITYDICFRTKPARR